MWNNDERKIFGNALVTTAKLYDKEIGIDVAKLVIDDLEDLHFDQCLQALVSFRRDSKNKFWPRASDIRAIINPPLDSRTIAIEMARKIDKAVAKHGWVWQEGFYAVKDGISFRYWNDSDGNIFYSFKEAVISELGDIGWHTICARGGWLRVRDSANSMEEGIFISQMRDQIQASIALKQQGLDITMIEMPKREQIEEGLQKQDFTKLLERK